MECVTACRLGVHLANFMRLSPRMCPLQELRSVGISPDFLICRSSTLLDDDTKYALLPTCL